MQCSDSFRFKKKLSKFNSHKQSSKLFSNKTICLFETHNYELYYFIDYNGKTDNKFQINTSSLFSKLFECKNIINAPCLVEGFLLSDFQISN